MESVFDSRVRGARGLRRAPGERLLQLDQQAAGAPPGAALSAAPHAPAAAAPAAVAAAAAAQQRHLPHLHLPAPVLGVLLPERRQVLQRHHPGLAVVQLRVQGGLHRAALRVQGPRRLLPPHQGQRHAGDGFDSDGGVPRVRARRPGLLRRVGRAHRPGPQPTEGRSALPRRSAPARARAPAPSRPEDF